MGVDTSHTHTIIHTHTRLGDGQAIVFDDSFEHEVVHEGGHVRYVLYAVLQHPDVEAAECSAVGGEGGAETKGGLTLLRAPRTMPNIPRG